MKLKRIALTLLIIVLFALPGCAEKSVEAAAESLQSQEMQQDLSPAEQKEKAYDILKQILALSDEPYRNENLEQIKKLYREIIDKYPEQPLAQESYLRLVLIYKEEKTQEADKKAQFLYQQYLEKYPGAKFGEIIKSVL